MRESEGSTNRVRIERLALFDIPAEAVRWVFDLNFAGVLLPSQVFGKQMAECGEGVILNFSSMNAFRPLTRVPASRSGAM